MSNPVDILIDQLDEAEANVAAFCEAVLPADKRDGDFPIATFIQLAGITRERSMQRAARLREAAELLTDADLASILEAHGSPAAHALLERIVQWNYRTLITNSTITRESVDR